MLTIFLVIFDKRIFHRANRGKMRLPVQDNGGGSGPVVNKCVCAVPWELKDNFRVQIKRQLFARTNTLAGLDLAIPPFSWLKLMFRDILGIAFKPRF